MSISSKLFRSALLSCLIFVGAGTSRAEDIKAAPQNQQLSPQLKWRVEVIFRSHAELPPESTVDIGPRTASPVPGYDQVRISILRMASDQSLSICSSQGTARRWLSSENWTRRSQALRLPLMKLGQDAVDLQRHSASCRF